MRKLRIHFILTRLNTLNKNNVDQNKKNGNPSNNSIISILIKFMTLVQLKQYLNPIT